MAFQDFLFLGAYGFVVPSPPAPLFLHPGAVTEELSSYVVVVRRRRFSPPHTYTYTFTYTFTSGFCLRNQWFFIGKPMVTQLETNGFLLSLFAIFSLKTEVHFLFCPRYRLLSQHKKKRQFFIERLTNNFLLFSIPNSILSNFRFYDTVCFY